MTRITESRILILAADGFEQSELQTPLLQLRAHGAAVEIAAPAQTIEPGRICGWRGELRTWGDKFPVDVTLGLVEMDGYDALVIPGGLMGPDKLRANPDAVALVQDFVDAGKVVAAICHGPWLLVEAGAARGRHMTSVPNIRTDLINAGAEWEDSAVVTDEGIITSRTPKDLDAFVAKIVEEVREGTHARSDVITRTAGTMLGLR